MNELQARKKLVKQLLDYEAQPKESRLVKKKVVTLWFVVLVRSVFGAHALRLKGIEVTTVATAIWVFPHVNIEVAMAFMFCRLEALLAEEYICPVLNEHLAIQTSVDHVA